MKSQKKKKSLQKWNYTWNAVLKSWQSLPSCWMTKFPFLCVMTLNFRVDLGLCPGCCRQKKYVLCLKYTVKNIVCIQLLNVTICCCSLFRDKSCLCFWLFVGWFSGLPSSRQCPLSLTDSSPVLFPRRAGSWPVSWSSSATKAQSWAGRNSRRRKQLLRLRRLGRVAPAPAGIR